MYVPGVIIGDGSAAVISFAEDNNVSVFFSPSEDSVLGPLPTTHQQHLDATLIYPASWEDVDGYGDIVRPHLCSRRLVISLSVLTFGIVSRYLLAAGSTTSILSRIDVVGRSVPRRFVNAS